MSSYDVIILGSSPNALTAAAFLARDGKRVLVLEPTEEVGGAADTTEFTEGFKADVGFISGSLNPSIVDDLKLSDHGLKVIQRNWITSLLPDGRSFSLAADRDAAAEAICAFAPADAAKYKPFMELVDLAADFLRSVYDTNPPVQHPPSVADAEKLTELVGRLKGYGRREMTEVMRLLVMSVRDLLDEWFESPELKGLLAATGVRGLNQGPFAGSTAFNLLHHCAIDDGYFRATAEGGIGAIAQSLLKAATAYGAELRTGVGSMRVIVTDGVASGVEVAGESISANSVVSDYDVLRTFSRLVPPPDLEPEFNRAVRRVRFNGTVARVNLALRELPQFSGVNEEALTGTLTVAPSMAYIEKAFDSAKRGKLSDQPVLDVTIPSLLDGSLAPSGKHVMSVWVQYAPYRDQISAEQVRDVVLAMLSAHEPELNSLIEHLEVIMPRDFETIFKLSEGHLYGGEMSLAQAFYLRPIPGFARYETPVTNLYLCGAATHPGGGVHGLCGRNAARELGVRDLVPA